MRVIAGSARGRQLVSPRGTATRPITDRVKETLFGILGERVIGARVLDLYAGSGSVGIEALSRGAASCEFVERDHRAVAAIRENLDRADVAKDGSVHQMDVLRYLDHAADPLFNLVFVDPPYEERAILAPLERLLARLARGAVVVVKHHWRTPIPEPSGLTRWRERRFGETTLTFLVANDGADGVEE
ncbi:MAG: 16S rRNA (guanine(966)-N(2))-methyltransferase RsmD [Chloroflexi bacterium]|nr:16S rRNA (guanine(966)-N(2))-methyltransferase RsmD [Chloroflexota bacterium]